MEEGFLGNILTNIYNKTYRFKLYAFQNQHFFTKSDQNMTKRAKDKKVEEVRKEEVKEEEA